MNKEIDMISYSCGLHHARQLRREHVRIVETADKSVALNIFIPIPTRTQVNLEGKIALKCYLEIASAPTYSRISSIITRGFSCVSTS